MRTLLPMLLIVSSIAGAQPTDAGTARSAKQLNVDGYELYKAGEWQQAADRFKDAFTADPKLAIAHYNFASTAFRSRQADGCAELSYPLTEAIEHLATSLRLDKGRLARLATDPDFTEFRQTARYHTLRGANLDSVRGLAAVLPKLKLRAPTRADSGPSFRLEFHPGGAVDVFDNVQSEHGWGWLKRPGSWRLKRIAADGGQTIVLELDAPATQHVPSLRYSGVVEVGPLSLVLRESKVWPFFASDEWVECCC